MTEFENFETREVPRSLPARILGRFGLVYGEGLSEYGLRHVGWGIPIHRKAILEAAQESARNTMAQLEEAQSRPRNETDQ